MDGQGKEENEGKMRGEERAWTEGPEGEKRRGSRGRIGKERGKKSKTRRKRERVKG